MSIALLARRSGWRNIARVELVDPTAEPKQHKWLEWLGLEEPPPEPDSWVAVARDIAIDDLDSGSSSEASGLVDALNTAGIQARRRSYTYYDASLFTDSRQPRFAVLVHERDLARATQIGAEFERQEQESLAKSDEELAREALEAEQSPQG
jgi:hypothetical protein